MTENHVHKTFCVLDIVIKILFCDVVSFNVSGMQ